MLFVVESDVLLCAVCCRVGCVALCDVVLLCDVMESDVLVCVMPCCFVMFVMESDVLVCAMLCCLESYLQVCKVFV